MHASASPRSLLLALGAVSAVSAQTIYDVISATSSVQVFYPTITAVNAAAATDSAATYLETSGTGSTATTRTRIQYQSSNSYRETHAGAALVSSQTVQLTTVYNGICTYTVSASTGSCTDTWNYISGAQTLLSQIQTYPGTVTSYVLGASQSESSGTHLSNGAVAGIIIAVIVILAIAVGGIFLLLRRQRQHRVRRSLNESANRRSSAMDDDPFGNAAAANAGGHGRARSDDAKPWGPNATYFGGGGEAPEYKRERDTAAEHGTQSTFTIGEDLPSDVADEFAHRSRSEPRPESSSGHSLARVPVPSYAAGSDNDHDLDPR